MSRDNSSQPLKYAARHSVNCLTVLALVWCAPAAAIRSPTTVIGLDSEKKSLPPAESLWSTVCAAPRTLFYGSFFHIHSAANLHLPWDAIQGPTTKRRALLDVLLAVQTP
ncbi:hypothetical protein TcCL_NonESM05766 [Trypanosoma cruzi]|nr:hypothetical protein TcCL_NonESM05766 [Trypanosoma cruzi]